jgi:guanylate kinase
VEETRDAGRDVLLELDVKGAQRVRAREPHAVLVFLVPPSFAELEERLRGRETEDEAAIQRRLETARWELQQEGSFDHVVVNDDLDRAADEVAAIIEASRTPDLL